MVLLAIATAAAPSDAAQPAVVDRRYETSFSLTQSPLSENGTWRHFGQDWTLITSSGGVAFGTQKGTGTYDDSYAYLSGFSPDQTASAVVHIDPAISNATSHEAEILLRWADSAHSARGYECIFSYDGGYVQIVRWNGARGDFSYLAGGPAPNGGEVPGGLHEGDTLSASIVGSRIAAYVNGVEVADATDNTWTTGDPGIGFYRGSSSGYLLGDLAFTSFAASSTSSTFPAVVSAPIGVRWWLLFGSMQCVIGVLLLRRRQAAL